MFLSAVFAVSCQSSTYDDVSVVNTNPTYEADIKPILSALCTSCHSFGGQFPALENYDQAKSATENGRLLCKIEGSCGSIMPTSGKMAQGTIDKINLWATNGFINQ